MPGLAHQGPSHLFTRIHNKISWSRFVYILQKFLPGQNNADPFTQLLALPKIHFPRLQLVQIIDGALKIFAGCSKCLRSRLLTSPCELVEKGIQSVAFLLTLRAGR